LVSAAAVAVYPTYHCAVTTRNEPEAIDAPTLAALRAHRDEILRIAERRGVSNVRVFGSVARGDAGPGSDIDLLVDFDASHRGLDLFGFEREVEELLGHPVEVGTNVAGAIRQKVEVQAIPL
jgi:predicted nucleotidyltransferase